MKTRFLLLVLAACSILSASAVTPEELILYINPGHGGYNGANDRNVVIPPFEEGDSMGYWESKSNLVKGLALRDMLEERGYKVVMSRIFNREEDDLNLSTIGHLANNAGSDFFLSIHSNATGTATRMNRPLMIYKGYTGEPTHPGSEVYAEIANRYLLKNDATVWTSTALYIVGDWTFYHSWGDKVGLGVLRQLTIPGILSEGSFHDYVPEAYRLLNNEFCWAEGYHFLKSYEEYFGIESKETTGVVAGVAYDNKFLREGDFKMFDRDVYLPLESATIELCSSDGATVLQTYTTDPIPNGFFLFKDVAPGTYMVRVKKDTHFTTEASVEVLANQINYVNIAVKKQRNTPPDVEQFSPAWKEGESPVLCNTPVVLHFNWDMDIESTEKAFKIEPAISGNLEWSESNFVLTFTPNQPYQPNTLYTVTIDKSAMHAGEVPMVESRQFQFMTDSRDYLTMLTYFPREGSQVHIKSPTVYMCTDRPLSSNTATTGVTVTDDTDTKISFSTRSIGAGKATEAYGWVKLPLSKTLTAGSEYQVTIPQTVADLDGIHFKNDIIGKFTAVDMSVAKDGAVTVEGFDDATLFAANDTDLNNATVTLTKDSSGKLFGTACLQAKYTFTTDNGGSFLITPTSASESFTDKDVLEINVNGDLSHNNAALILSDGTEEIAISLGVIDYYGWQCKRVDLGGALQDGKTYKLAGVKVSQTGTVQGAEGTLKFDNLVVLNNQSDGVETIEMTTVKVYPNPASEYVVANADGFIDSVELYAVDGSKVRATSGNVLYVADVVPGTYVVKVKIAGSTVVRKIVINHE